MLAQQSEDSYCKSRPMDKRQNKILQNILFDGTQHKICIAMCKKPMYYEYLGSELNLHCSNACNAMHEYHPVCFLR